MRIFALTFSMGPRLILKIISGGQTGADRAALDFAIKHRISHGGWCPKGRRSEDGTIPSQYQLQETPSTNYLQRTEWNVRDSDGTVIFSISEHLTGGSSVRLAIRKSSARGPVRLPTPIKCWTAWVGEAPGE
jgi:hypothetical protein